MLDHQKAHLNLLRLPVPRKLHDVVPGRLPPDQLHEALLALKVVQLPLQLAGVVLLQQAHILQGARQLGTAGSDLAQHELGSRIQCMQLIAVQSSLTSCRGRSSQVL